MASARPDGRFGVVACVEREGSTLHSSDVVAQLAHGSAEARAAAVAALDDFDVVVLQHEFGIYGGDDGAEVLDLIAALRVPVVAVLHTVPRAPSPGQRAVLERLALLADRLVVQSGSARTRLLEQYAVDARKVTTIPHGARPNLHARPRRAPGEPPVVLSWGLLGGDKGIEWGIEAIARLRGRGQEVRYVVVGQTHPRILERVGEDYRESLLELAASLGVADLVEFDNAYHDTRSLLARVREADAVLLPYRSREQVVSGVLVEALASGKPVVATRFPHAEELLREGSGLLVPHEDADAIADALHRLVTEPGFAASAEAVARLQARSLFWSSVGERYAELAAATATLRMAPRVRVFPAPSFEHLLRLSDEVGVFEHAKLTLPRTAHGYCTDDVARALVAVLREPVPPPRLERLAERCLAFLESAQRPDGRFRNRLSVERRWLDEVGSDDSNGRALWAAGTAAVGASRRELRQRALALLEAGAGFDSPSPRANAFAVLGAAEVIAAAPVTAAYGLCERAAGRLGHVSPAAAWPWPEGRLAYANAVLPEARIAAGVALEDEVLVEEGLALLRWLVETETRDGRFSFAPAGGWGPGERRPGFDQQPIEAAAMADACARAYDVTGDATWADLCLRAAAWFLGANDVGAQLLDPASGGGCDGLERRGVNRNEGAESTLALITALQQARRLQAAARSAPTTSAVSTVAAPTQRSAAPYVR